MNLLRVDAAVGVVPFGGVGGSRWVVGGCEPRWDSPSERRRIPVKVSVVEVRGFEPSPRWRGSWVDPSPGSGQSRGAGCVVRTGIGFAAG